MAFTKLVTSFLASAFLACSITNAVTGKATEANIAMITITMSSSIRVKAEDLLLEIFDEIIVLMVIVGN